MSIKVNKHGVLIMEVLERKVKVLMENSYFCKTKGCKGKAKNTYREFRYCDECYMRIIDYGCHVFD